MISILKLFWKFRSNPLRTLTNIVTYFRQGQFLVQLAMSLLNTSILLRVGSISDLPIPYLMILILFCFLPLLIVIGYYDYKKGTYQSTAILSIKNSPPARDTYILFYHIADQYLPHTEEIEQLKNRFKEWGGFD